MTARHVTTWAHRHPLSPVHVDCATAVMLKILDGKCKMSHEEKVYMALLYNLVKHRPGVLLGDEVHRMIADAYRHLDDAMRERIYEQRVLAETMISRPVMKGFKAMLREEGLFQAGAMRA